VIQYVSCDILSAVTRLEKDGPFLTSAASAPSVSRDAGAHRIGRVTALDSFTGDMHRAAEASVVLGVDGGRSKTVAVVADMRGRILGSGRAGNAAHPTTDADIHDQFVLEAAEAALLDASVDRGQIAVGMFGLAGVDWPEDFDRRRASLGNLGVTRHIVVGNDAFLGWRASLSSQEFGVVVAAGTGAMVGVIAADGQAWHYGAYARSGGAQTIARDALTAVYRAEDGTGEPTELTGLVLSEMGLSSTDALLRADGKSQLISARVFGLAAHVMEAASKGDVVAAEIVTDQGEYLAQYAAAAIRRFSMELDEFDVVLSGGLFRSRNQLLLETLISNVRRVAPRVRFVHPGFEPVIGAVLQAYDHLGVVVTQDTISNLTCTAPPATLFDTLMTPIMSDSKDPT